MIGSTINNTIYYTAVRSKPASLKTQLTHQILRLHLDHNIAVMGHTSYNIDFLSFLSYITDELSLKGM